MIKQDTENFIQYLILIDNTLDKYHFDEDERQEYMSRLLYNYLNANLHSLVLHNNPDDVNLTVDMFGETEAKVIDEMLTVIMVDYKHAYNNFVDDSVRDLLDFMISVVERWNSKYKVEEK